MGFSYGTRVNNSSAAAEDVYDFLQKFFILFPHLSGSVHLPFPRNLPSLIQPNSNRFYISGGSYGGVYVPNIATVIHEENKAIQAGKGKANAELIDLQALILSNPLSDPMTHWTWLLQYRCVLHQVYNSTTCTNMYTKLPSCIDSIRSSFSNTADRAGRVKALEICGELNDGDAHGIVIEDIRRTVSLIHCFLALRRD